MLKKELGDATYRDSIRNAFKTAASVEIPEVYNYLWKLKVSGILNLNIDRIATRAYSSVSQNQPLIEFCGCDIAGFVHLLKGTKQFVANLHGHHENTNSWIFTKSDLNNLFTNAGYKTFLQSCITTRTLIFVGISADDIAVGSHIKNLLDGGIDFGNHFWITDRRDLLTDEWAERSNLRIIRYPSCDNHSALIEILKDIHAFMPQDDVAPPILPNIKIALDEVLPKPEELVKYDSNFIRIILNKKANDLLADENTKYEEYENFCREYDEPIYRAWYATEEIGKNIFFDYKLEKLHAKGAFGRVYRAINNTGELVAIKILLEEERTRQDFIQSFRRGVRSMKILADRNVDGMVRYIEAYEIPAFVVMDWINGPNLMEAVESKKINDWYKILKVSTELATIIESAHRLPERVLHRDLRPPNIMLENFYSTDDWKIVVLDFDLSWHVGAAEKSVLNSASATCFLAPEQIQKNQNISTRHSAVDSFGLGMTLFYMISKRNPFPAEHNHKDWIKTVNEASSDYSCREWVSISNRFARLIINCTKDKQFERWDLVQIKNELLRLYNAILDPQNIPFAELVAEEIMANTDCKKNYTWNDNDLSAEYDLGSGIKIKVIGHESKKKIIQNIRWQSIQVSETKKIKKWLPKAKDKVIHILKHYNWEISHQSIDGHSLIINADITSEFACKNIKQSAKSINEVINCLNFR